MAKIEIETRYTVDLSKLGPERRTSSISMGNSTFTMGLSEPNWTFRFNGHDYPEEIRDALIWCLDNLRNSEIKTEDGRILLTTTNESDIAAFKMRWC